MGDIRVTFAYEQHSITSYGTPLCCTVSYRWSRCTAAPPAPAGTTWTRSALACTQSADPNGRSGPVQVEVLAVDGDKGRKELRRAIQTASLEQLALALAAVTLLSRSLSPAVFEQRAEYVRLPLGLTRSAVRSATSSIWKRSASRQPRSRTTRRGSSTLLRSSNGGRASKQHTIQIFFFFLSVCSP
jgi:hypothetical protein